MYFVGFCCIIEIILTHFASRLASIWVPVLTELSWLPHNLANRFPNVSKKTGSISKSKRTPTEKILYFYCPTWWRTHACWVEIGYADFECTFCSSWLSVSFSGTVLVTLADTVVPFPCCSELVSPVRQCSSTALLEHWMKNGLTYVFIDTVTFIVVPCIMESIYCSLTNKCTFY